MELLKKQILTEERFQYSSQLVKFVNEKNINKESIVSICGVDRGEGYVLFYFTYERLVKE
jgi:hypothetical protein